MCDPGTSLKRVSFSSEPSPSSDPVSAAQVLFLDVGKKNEPGNRNISTRFLLTSPLRLMGKLEFIPVYPSVCAAVGTSVFTGTLLPNFACSFAKLG